MIYLHMKKDCFNMFVIYIFVKSKKSRKNQKIVVQIRKEGLRL